MYLRDMVILEEQQRFAERLRVVSNILLDDLRNSAFAEDTEPWFNELRAIRNKISDLLLEVTGSIQEREDRASDLRE